MFNLKKSKKRMVALCLTAALSVGSLTAYAATEYWNDASTVPGYTTKTVVSQNTDWAQWKANWDKVKANHEQVALVPGSDFSKLNFGWYSKTKVNDAVVRVADNKEMKNAKEFKGTCQAGTVIGGVQYYTNKVAADGFKPNSTYYYQVQINGQWQDVHEYKTGDPHNFSFMYVGDPQIGASKGQVPSDGSEKQSADIAARNDAFNWNKTMNNALAQHPEINFLVSPGDQINEPAEDQSAAKIQMQEYQYAGYLSPAALRSLPAATSIGNHDCMTSGYQNHFNVPNPFTEETNSTKAGYGYYYTYGSALFIVINANNYNAADHQALIEKAIKAHPDTKWRIVVMHQDIYGSGKDHSDSDGILLRTQLTPAGNAKDPPKKQAPIFQYRHKGSVLRLGSPHHGDKRPFVEGGSHDVFQNAEYLHALPLKLQRKNLYVHTGKSTVLLTYGAVHGQLAGAGKLQRRRLRLTETGI